MTTRERQQAAISALIEVQSARAAIEKASGKLQALCADIGMTHPVAGTLADARELTVKAQLQLEQLTERIPIS